MHISLGKPGIDISLVLEIMDKSKLGLARKTVTETGSKMRYALSQASKAVVMVLSPGVTPVDRVLNCPRLLL